MATYTITTSDKQEQGLKFNYDNYGDKTLFPTQAEYLQWRVEQQVLNPMYTELQRSVTASFDASFKTIPEENKAQAAQDIGTAITSNGGTLVTIAPPTTAPAIVIPLPPPVTNG